MMNPTGCCRRVYPAFALAGVMLAASWSSADPALFVVEVGAEGRRSLLASMEAQGLRYVGVLDEHRIIVRGEGAALAGWDGARSFEALTAGRKAPATLLERLEGMTGLERSEPSAYVVLPSVRDAATRARVGELIDAAGGHAGLIASENLGMRAVVDAAGVSALLASPDVVWVEPASEPETDDDLLREFGGANYVELVDGFTGAGVPVEVVDSGLRVSHQDLLGASPELRTLNSNSLQHGTSSFGILFGDGVGDPEALGLIPSATALFSSYFHIPDRDAHLACLSGEPYLGQLQSNSWGSAVSRRYTAISAEMDHAIFRHGVVVVQSQSNAGTPDSRPEAWAKNIVSVGGVQGRGTLSRDDDAWGGVASTGPAVDGRIKPDLVMFNDGIWTTDGVGDGAYRSFTGTSAATPAVSGHFAIMMEMWAAGLFRGDAPAGPGGLPADQSPVTSIGWSPRPSVAMARALMINSARAYPFAHGAEDLGRYRQGWGTPDLRRLRDAASRTRVVDEEYPLRQGKAWARGYRVDPFEPELRITLVYMDPPALPNAATALINDLDLRVTSPSGRVYLGNGGLHDGIWSVEGGSPDRVNTVENVFVEFPEAGVWMVEVIARVVLEDALPETPAFDASFALVASGVRPWSGGEIIRPVDELPGAMTSEGQTRFVFEAVAFTPAGNGTVVMERNGAITALPLVWDGDTRYEALIEGVSCGEEVRMRFIAPTIGWMSASYPLDSRAMLTLRGEEEREILPGAGTSWEASSDPGLVSGSWQHGTPVGGGLRWDPPFDADGDGVCWLTDNRVGASGVSGGTARLVSPAYDLRGAHSGELRAHLWVACDDAGRAGEDAMTIEYSVDDGASWVPLGEERSTFRWAARSHPLPAQALGWPAVRFRFSIGDEAGDSITEAGVDGLRVVADGCGWCPADFDRDGILGLNDLVGFVGAFLDQDPPSDFDGNGSIDLLDLIMFSIAFNQGCG
jgi:hypothetical protein